MEDLKAKIEEAVNKIKADPNIATKFQENPVKTIEDIVGIDLPDDQINEIINGIKAKLTLDQGSDLLGKITGMFSK